MSTSFSRHEFIRYINPAFPDRPKRLPRLTNDELICAFLATHGVEVIPVDADIQMSRGEAALMGASLGLVNPVTWDAMTTGAQMKQDARIAARQEWISWKQWSLSHADWQQFKESAVADYRYSLDAAESWENDPLNQQQFQELVTRGREKDREEDRRIAKYAAITAGVITGIAVLLWATDRLSERNRSTPPAPEQRTSRLISP